MIPVGGTLRLTTDDGGIRRRYDSEDEPYELTKVNEGDGPLENK